MDKTSEIFDKGLKIMGDVDQVERKLLRNLFRTSAHVAKLKAPNRSSNEEPKRHTLDDIIKGKIEDENLWVWEL